MNVLTVTSSYPRHPGDATAPFIESTTRGLAARGHSIDLVLPRHPLLHPDAAGPIAFFPYDYAPTDASSLWGYGQRAPLWLAPFAALALRREIDARMLARRYDVVHVHGLFPDAAIVRSIVRAHGVAMLLSVHDDDPAFDPAWWAMGFARLALDEAAVVTACRDRVRAGVLALGGHAARTFTVPYGVDVHAFSPDVPHAGVRERLGATAEGFLVLASGPLEASSGFELLIEAAAKTGGIELAIVGEGPRRAVLETRAKELGVRARIAGDLDRDARAAAYAAADVIVVPAQGGDRDRRVLEALASGRPIVAGDDPEIRKFLENEVTGLVVPSADPGEWAGALRRLVRETETSSRLAGQARRTAVERWSWEAVARGFEELYAQAALRAAA